MTVLQRFRTLKTVAVVRSVVCLLLPVAAISVVQSCGQRNGAEMSETQKPNIDPLQDSVGLLDKEIEELRRQKQKLDQELENVGPVRWEVGEEERLSVAETFPEGEGTPAALVAALNKHRDAHPQLPNPVMEFEEIRGNTAYVRLLHGERLTQQMGSAGAAQYLAEATFTLTSLPGVESVNFEFEEGDHAAPGAYTRANWEGVFEIGQ